MTKTSRLLCLTIVFSIVCSLSPISFAQYVIGSSESGLAQNSLIDNLKTFIGHREEDFLEVYDESGKYIFGSCMGLSKGDRYINEENKEYEVIKISEEKAIAKYLGEVDLLAGEKILGSLEDLPPMVQGKQEKRVGLYHTHSAESYKPGPAFNDKGEIYDVGASLKTALEEQGITVIQSKDSFLPHDGGAYDRSRSTAATLLKQGVDAIFDLHRDAIPRANEYLTEVEGKEMSKIRLVVGRQNPNRGPNDQLAKRFKAVSDEKYPGLIKGIFYANGKYNQDLSPKALLFEFGTHVTTEKEAIRSAAKIADIINTVLYGSNTATGGGKEGTDRAMGTAGWRNFFWIIGFLVFAGILFLLINEKGRSGISKRIKEFSGEEFANILGRISRRKKRVNKKRK